MMTWQRGERQNDFFFCSVFTASFSKTKERRRGSKFFYGRRHVAGTRGRRRGDFGEGVRAGGKNEDDGVSVRLPGESRDGECHNLVKSMEGARKVRAGRRERTRARSGGRRLRCRRRKRSGRERRGEARAAGEESLLRRGLRPEEAEKRGTERPAGRGARGRARCLRSR